MLANLENAAKRGWQGEVLYALRMTEDALLRRGLITYEYDDRWHPGVKELGYRNPVLTVAGWEASGVDRPEDPGRYTLVEALWEATGSDVGPQSEPVGKCTCPELSHRTGLHLNGCPGDPAEWGDMSSSTRLGHRIQR
jgi:hypothetical protein